jgi:hypothetical protein
VNIGQQVGGECVLTVLRMAPYVPLMLCEGIIEDTVEVETKLKGEMKWNSTGKLASQIKCKLT